MKQMKFLAITFILLMGVAVTSCIDSDNEQSWDHAEFMTITESYLGTGIVMKGDASGYTFIPDNPSALQLQGTSTTSYPERARVYCKFKEGEVVAEGKTKYNVTIVGCDIILPVRDFCNPDTLKWKEGAPIIGIDEQNVWGANGFINLGFIFNYTNGLTYNHFDMYPVKVEDNVLYVKFHENVEKTNSYGEQKNGLMSFRLPSLHDLRYAFPDLQPVGSTNDSINLKIIATGSNDTSIEKGPIKVKVNN